MKARAGSRSIRLCVTAWAILGNSAAVWATTWSVNTTANDGVGSLRNAIDSANSHPSPPRDTIVFGIAGAGPHTILLDSVLSPITNVGLVIDGYSQFGSAPNTLAQGNDAVLTIELRQVTPGTLSGIDIMADSCTVRGIAICDFRHGIQLSPTSQGSTVQGNWLGLLASGTAPGNVLAGITVNASSHNQIGGTAPASRNIISGNGNGVMVQSGAMYNHIEGNYIGTNTSGTAALANAFAGVSCLGADSNHIGGSSSGAGNLISGNTSHEVYMVAGCEGNTVSGNVMGLDQSGSVVISGTYGLSMFDAVGNTIGGSAPGARNTISGHGSSNVYASNDATRHNRFQGNYFGTDSSGLVGMANPGGGIQLVGADSNIIGGLDPAERNIFASLSASGLSLVGSADANLVVGNWFGVDASYNGMANGFANILIGDSRYNQIGTTDWTSGNSLAYASQKAIRVTGTSDYNTILSNVTFHNVGLGIDLEPLGVTANDSADGDAGPNGLQNYPVLTASHSTAAGTVVEGSLNSVPNEAFLIQVFASEFCNASGYGEGWDINDTFTVVTDALGKVSFAQNMLVDAVVGRWLTATATSDLGSTSEFSACTQVEPAEVNDTLRFYLFSPVDMVVTDPTGDSIGIDEATDTIFNTILNGATYDTTSDAGGSSELDDVVTIAHPLAGAYRVRIFREDGAADSATFTTAIRINGNQLLIPEGYQDVALSALGTTLPDTVIWTAAVTLPGDVNADGEFTSSDLIYFVNYVFKSGPEPVVTGHGDVNCNDVTNSADIIHMVNFIFKGGLPPCSQSGG